MTRTYLLRQLATTWEFRREHRMRANFVTLDPEEALRRFARFKGCRPATVVVIDREGTTIAQHFYPADPAITTVPAPLSEGAMA